MTMTEAEARDLAGLLTEDEMGMVTLRQRYPDVYSVAGALGRAGFFPEDVSVSMWVNDSEDE